MNIRDHFTALAKALRPPPKPKAKNAGFRTGGYVENGQVKNTGIPTVDMSKLFEPRPLSQRAEVEALARLLHQQAKRPLMWMTCCDNAEQNEFRHQAVGLLAAEHERIMAYLRANDIKH